MCRLVTGCIPNLIKFDRMVQTFTWRDTYTHAGTHARAVHVDVKDTHI